MNQTTLETIHSYIAAGNALAYGYNGKKVDKMAAFNEFLKAALLEKEIYHAGEQVDGLGHSCYRVGKCLLDGVGVKQDWIAATFWFKIARFFKVFAASRELGKIALEYYEDHHSAVVLFTEAIDRGDYFTKAEVGRLLAVFTRKHNTFPPATVAA